MNISDYHNFIDLITSQERGGFNTPAEKDSALDRANMTLFEYYRPIYSTSIEANEALSPFKVKYDFITNSTGQITLTSGQEFVRLLSMLVFVSDPTTPSGYDPNRTYPVAFVNEDELADRLNSQNKQPLAIAPVAYTHGIGWYDLYPQQVHSGTMYFLKRPQKPIYAYTQVGRVITYDAANSQQLLWTEPYANKVVFLALRYLGINLDNDKLVAYATQFVNTNV
jgi:hypothetical protein